MTYELEDVFKSRFYESPLHYDNINWFMNEVFKLENKMVFYFKNTDKEIITTDEDEEVYRNIIFADFMKIKF